ncbi:Serine protease, partial [hydrothermal vent metagenome]
MAELSDKLTFEDLAEIAILADTTKGALKAAAKAAKWVRLPGGKPLFLAGDIADSIYFVKSGVLGAFHLGADAELELLGYIRPGEPVGEMAFLAAAPHASPVYALRDAELICLPRAAFDKLSRKSPGLMRALTQMTVMRLRSNNRQNAESRSQPKVFAMLATSPTIAPEHLAKQLAKQLGKMGISSIIIGPDAKDSSPEWFDKQEQNHDVVLMHSPIADDGWFRLCLRQADRLWILGRADARPSDPLLPVEDSPARAMRLVDVILLHNKGVSEVSAGHDWKKAAGAARIFHWRNGNQDDIARIARTAAGRSVGLVLSGGGARAYAHIGAVRALREANIPIDFCGGTSMGAIIAANVAMGWDDEQIENCIMDAFVKSNPVDDYVLPVVSLTGGAKV